MRKKEINKKITTDLEAIINISYYNNNRTNKVINKSFPCSIRNFIINNKTRSKNYELYNVVSETGDSIYAPQYEELKLEDDYKGGQIFVSESAIKEIVNRIIDQKRLGTSLNNIKYDN